MTNKKLSHPKYRADIDGIRAIAILLVVGFHAFGLKGGFIGVDIFFVISGFLISTIIFNNLDSSRFSFAQFYLRRIKRIFPALLFMLVVCLAFGWFVLFSDEYKQLGKHLFYGTAFISNFALLTESGYFDNAAETKPLLHLWSLAIEEQFYIIWPFLVWAIWKRRFNILAVIILIALASFIFSISKIQENKIAAFYLPQSRFWELLIGSALSYLAIYKKNIFLNLKIRIDKLLSKIILRAKQKTDEFLVGFLSIFGASLVVFGVVFIDKDKSFPGFWALLPTLGTAFVIAAGSKAWFNRVILQNKALIWFGLISFPLYLWHWPILTFATIIKGETPSIFVRIFAVIISIILAWLTYCFVEKPIRFGKNNNDKKAIIFLVSLMILVGFVGYVCFKKDGIPTRKYIVDAELQSKDLMTPYKSRKSDGSCDDLGLNLGKLICLKNSKQPEILIIGDSHAMAINSSAYSGEVNLKTILIAQHSCIPFRYYGFIREGREFKECHNLGTAALSIFEKIRSIQTIIINTNVYYSSQKTLKREIFSFKKNNHETQEEMFLSGYNDIISKLILSGKNVIFIIDNPDLGFNPKSCVKRPLFPLQNDCSVGKKMILDKQNYYRELVGKIAKKNPKLKIFDSLGVFCDDNFCYAKDDKNIFYWDSNHLNVNGSKKLLNNLIQSGLLNTKEHLTIKSSDSN